jgi:hypothetical protein
MEARKQKKQKIRISFKEMLGMIIPYVKKRIVEQIKSVSIIILYLILFQMIILGIPIVKASIVATGIVLVVVGLAFFMEGLLLGLMPLGETIGVKLPQKTKLAIILIFAFILGVGATFAEPAIGILKVVGASVKAWEAPLLFLILNKFSNYLVLAVAVGVGIAVVAGMLRFIYNWSLKPFIYILFVALTALSGWAYFDPNMCHVTGLSWDCGAVTTGPVTVPLVLALGIGISRVVSKGESSLGGFGVVTLASAFPILTVLSLGIILVNTVPLPMQQDKFLNHDNRKKVLTLFHHEDQLSGYVLQNASMEAQIVYFDQSKDTMLDFIDKLAHDENLQNRAFGKKENFKNWLLNQGSEEQKLAVFKTKEKIKEEMNKISTLVSETLDEGEILSRNAFAAMQAIIPLSLLLLFILIFILRDKILRGDEVIVGLIFAVIGMTLFNIGIELGLSRLGNQVGEKLPSSFKSIALTEQKQIINGFEPGLVQSAIKQDGKLKKFFYADINKKIVSIPYDENYLDETSKQYTYTPTRGPLFGNEGGILGIIVVLIFGFIMGYGATLAEPALNALGITVEELSVGTFKKSLLMQTVALGVGAGIMLGVAKIIWDIPLIWMLVPPYLLLLLVTKISTEEYVNIGWDSAGVTTGPITVPLVLAMGLGISGQVGIVEGFGILAMASVMPILAVLCVGLYVDKKRKAALEESVITVK